MTTNKHILIAAFTVISILVAAPVATSAIDTRTAIDIGKVTNVETTITTKARGAGCHVRTKKQTAEGGFGVDLYGVTQQVAYCTHWVTRHGQRVLRINPDGKWYTRPCRGDDYFVTLAGSSTGWSYAGDLECRSRTRLSGPIYRFTKKRFHRSLGGLVQHDAKVWAWGEGYLSGAFVLGGDSSSSGSRR